MITTYTVKELIPILKKTEKTICNYINDKELKASWIGNGYVILEEDVKEFLRESYLFDYENIEDDEEEIEEDE